jgi:hypothetical protein
MSDITKISKNFGKIKSVYNNLLSESVIDKKAEKKALFKDYIKLLKENKILKTQFLVYNNIENKVENDRNKATLFVNENIALLNKFSKKEILKANKLLTNKIIFEYNVETNELHESITTLIFTEKTPSTIETIVENTDKIVNYILNNKPSVIQETIDYPNSMFSAMLVGNFNEKYSRLNENDKKFLKVLIDSNDDDKKELYSKAVKECLDLVNKRLETNDVELKEKLLKVKEKLLNEDLQSKEEIEKKLIKIADLTNILGQE